MKNCPFCAEYLDASGSQFYLDVGKQIGCESRILLETDNWYVIPTMGSLTVGYVLLVTKQHYLSLANLSREVFFEMLELKKRVEERLFRQLGMGCLTFEHGTVNSFSKGANSVDHVHVHMLPFAQSIWQDIVSDMPKTYFEVVDSYEALYDAWQKRLPNSYLLFQDVNQKIYYISDASNMPSQLFRKCLAPHLGADCWDWRSECYSDNIVQTMKLFERMK